MRHYINIVKKNKCKFTPKEMADELPLLWCKFALTVLLKQFEDDKSPVTNVKDFYLLVLKLISGSLQSNRLYLTLKAPIATKVVC